MGKFQCQFPGCDYSTDDRHVIHLHHIVPRSMGGPAVAWNEMLVCPNHHGRIYVRGMQAGIHSLMTESSIVVRGWRMSTEGRVLEYEDGTGAVSFHKPIV